MSNAKAFWIAVVLLCVVAIGVGITCTVLAFRNLTRQSVVAAADDPQPELAERSVEELINILGSGSTREVMAAAELLGRSGDPRAVKPLIEASRAHSYLDVVGPLRELGDAAIRGLVQRVEAGEIDLAPLAAEVAGEAAVETLVRAAEVKCEDEEVCRRLILALGRTGSVRAIDTLIALDRRSEQVDDEVRKALLAIGQAGAKQYVAMLQTTDDDEILEELLWVVGQLGLREAVPALVRMIEKDSESWGGMSTPAMQALSHIPRNGQAELFLRAAERLQNDPQNRYYTLFAAIGLGNEGDARAEPFLLAYLADAEAKYPAFGFEVEAFYALGRCRGPRSVETLIRLSDKYRQETDLQRDLLKAFGYTGDPRAAAQVRRWVESQLPHPAVGTETCVTNAIWSLGELADREALPLLRTLRDYQLHSVCGPGFAFPFRDAADEAIRKITQGTNHDRQASAQGDSSS